MAHYSQQLLKCLMEGQGFILRLYKAIHVVFVNYECSKKTFVFSFSQ